MDLSNDILNIKGIGDKTKKNFERLGVYTLGDILLHFPRTYYIYPQIIPEKDLSFHVGEKVAVQCVLMNDAFIKKTRTMDIVIAKGYMENISIEFVWFRSSYIKNQLYIRTPIVFFGKLLEENGTFKIEQPEVFSPMEYNNISKYPYPIYPLTRGISNTLIIKTIENVLSHVDIEEYLPEEIINDNNLMNRKEAFFIIHKPSSLKELEKARRRLAYDEIFRFMYYVLEYKNIEKPKNLFDINNYDDVNKVINSLPFELTNGQQKAFNDIKNDFKKDIIDQRLIQGDVGCGKTIIAFLTMLSCVSSGYQAALMAPTEVLATQHANDFVEILEQNALNYNVVLLTGSMKSSEKKKALHMIKNGECDFIIGTHTLIQESVDYNNLALVITDEQHRFGVKQRETLSKKGINPFTITMSATPIPRTLSLIIYCDMNISEIKDVPKSKLPIKNCTVKENKREACYNHIIKEVNDGRQAYVICPLVEAKEITEAENVKDYANKLKEYMPSDFRIGILHGKMKSKEKNDVMNSFVKNEIDILVATTVIEVGVNNPNATVIMIENAQRFGLAQLHQLRGRVGRGNYQSYCIFMDSTKDKTMNKRLEVMINSNDGFYIASEDLKLRGPGDIIGIRQSGEMNFRIADIYSDADLFIKVKSDLDKLLDSGYCISSSSFMLGEAIIE